LKQNFETLGYYIVETNNPHLVQKDFDFEVSEFLQSRGILSDERLVAGQLSLCCCWFSGSASRGLPLGLPRLLGLGEIGRPTCKMVGRIHPAGASV